MNASQILTKIKAYPLALGLFGAALVLSGWAYYRSGTLDDLHGEFDTVSAENDQIQANVKEGINLKEQLDQLNAAVAQFKPGLINPSAVIPNTQYFYDFEQSTGVQIIDPGQVGTVASKDPAEPSVTSFKLTAVGPWDKIITFLNALQTGPHYLRINQINFDRGMASHSGATVVQTVRVYLMIEVLGQ